ncbi:MAG TPA: OmpA family protein, partial [Anaerovoracaceae bacterium]|nr:OmpA family protein [Anaerovoracaceae bacterium]
PPVVIVPVPAPTPPAEVEQTVHTVVQFAVDSYKLDATAKALLDHVASKIKSATKVSDIVVEGHASSDGPLAHNNVLAQNRAKAVVDYLVSKGIDRSKLTAHGFGITRPVESNKTKTGRVSNRRAEVIVSCTVKVGS